MSFPVINHGSAVNNHHHVYEVSEAVVFRMIKTKSLHKKRKIIAYQCTQENTKAVVKEILMVKLRHFNDFSCMSQVEIFSALKRRRPSHEMCLRRSFQA